MGLDLTIYPMECIPDTGGWQKAYLLSDHLYFIRDYDIFKQIGAHPEFPRTLGGTCIHTEAIPADILIISNNAYREDDLGKTEDAYGERLRWCYASEFSKLELPSDILPYNAAILAFLKALPDKIRILLYWC